MTADRPSVAWGREHRAAVLGAVFALVGLAVAVRVRPVILLDDAAIIARYTRRIVDGRGWTYNDGDRTNGLSAPLYGIVVSGVHAGGIDPITSLRVVCAISYAATIGLVAYLGTRIVGLVGGVFAGLYLLLWDDFARQGLSGMESSLAAVLGMAVLVALYHESDTWAGLMLGLALLNKFDAGVLAVAVAAVVLVLRRRPPWRVAWISAAVMVPWLAFATLYFGSPLPHSFTQKASGSVVNPAADMSPTWVLAILLDQKAAPVMVAASVAVLVVYDLHRRGRTPAAVALGGALAWAVAHGVTFSLLDLGDRYSWYLTVLYPALALCAGCTLGHGFQILRSREARLVVPAALVLVGLFAVSVGVRPDNRGQPGHLARRLRAGGQVDDYLRFELARREAGRRVAELAEPGDVVATCFGWVAYEAYDHPIAEVCPLNTSREVGPTAWLVEGRYGSIDPPEPMAGWTLVDTFFPATDPPVGRMDIFRADPALDEPDDEPDAETGS